jgi:hypothetical protein
MPHLPILPAKNPPDAQPPEHGMNRALENGAR